MLSKPKNDCGCGGGKYNCLSKQAFAKWAKAEKKRLDCGCGCKGAKAFKKKYGMRGSGILADCPPGYRNDGLTCLEECKPGEVDDGLFCRDTNPPGPGWVNDGLTFRNTNPPGEGWVNDGLTFRNARCPDGWINDGLTCRKPIVTHVDDCPPGWNSDPLTCTKPIVTEVDDCPAGFRSDPLTCFKDLSCNSRWDGCCSRGLFGECYGCVRTDCSGPEARSRNPRTSGGEVISRNPRTDGGEIVGQEIRGQEIRPQPTRSKEIKGRVNFDELLKEVDKGIADLFSADGALARAFDPEKNGIGAAFRKFGDDMKRVLEEVGNQIKDGFQKMGESAKAAFEQMARDAESKFKAFGDDFVRMMKDPDFWVEAIGIMAMIAGSALSVALTVGTLGIGAPAAAGIMAACAMAGPAAKMIASAAKGEPIDALDIAAIAIAGATAVIPGMGPTVQTFMKVGTTAASFAISAVQVGQGLGMIPSTCIANCPPPPDYSPEPPLDPKLPPSTEPPPAGQKTDQEILDLAPPCTFFRVVGKANQPPPCNSMPRQTRDGPPYYTDEDWITHYRETYYGPNAVEEPGGAMITPEDKAIADSVRVNPPTQPPVNLNPTEEEELDLEVQDLDLDLDFGFGEDDGLDLNVGELPSLDEDEVPTLDLETGELDLDLGDVPELDLVNGEEELDLGGEELDLGGEELDLGGEELDLGDGEQVLDIAGEEEPLLDLAEEEVDVGDEVIDLEGEELNLDEASKMLHLDAELGDEVKLEEGGEPLLDLGEEVRNLERNSEMPEKPISAPIVPKAKPTKVPYKDRQLEEACYANRYPDVKSYYKIDPNNITEKNKEDLLQHWTVYGKREGRNPGCGAGRGRGMGKSLTLYYAEWCHFCKVIMPIWKKLRVPGVEIRMVEEKQNNELRVEGYPTIIYRNGNQMEKYSGPRTKAGIEKFLKNKL